jgi:hypothetical protein
VKNLLTLNECIYKYNFLTFYRCFQEILLYPDNFLINMGTCELCNRTEVGLSLREAKHKELGRKWVCSDCWTDLYQRNRMLSGSTSSGSSLCLGKCSSCPHS